MKAWVLMIAGMGSLMACAASVVPDTGPSASWRLQPTVPMMVPRAGHQATELPGARVLLTGGCSGSGCEPVERSTELFHVDSGRSESITAMAQARVSHVSAQLPGGQVLIAGGWDGSAALASAELFDPRTKTFSSTATMGTPRMDARATVLADGSVLVTGGARALNQAVADAEVFDPATGRFSVAGRLNQARVHHAAVRLEDGRVLVMGGLIARHTATASAEIYDPATGMFTVTGALSQPRCKHAAVRLQDGRVLVVSGSSDCNDSARMANTELYDPATGRFSPGPMLAHGRYKLADAVAVLPSGEVVVAGGADNVEIWTPGSPAFVKADGGIGEKLAFSTATALADGRVLILGGYDDTIRPTPKAWVVGREPAAGSAD